MQSRYFAKMDAADALDLEPRTRAEQALARASANVRRANRFMCWADAGCRAKVRDLREVERVRLAEANAFRAARDDAVREAKSELGLWSSLGVDEAKALFRQSYERGKLYATRTSYYDTFWLILAGRSDDSMLELLLRWGFHVLSNFTAGMIGAVWNYAWALPRSSEPSPRAGGAASPSSSSPSSPPRPSPRLFCCYSSARREE